MYKLSYLLIFSYTMTTISAAYSFIITTVLPVIPNIQVINISLKTQHCLTAQKPFHRLSNMCMIEVTTQK